MNIKDFFKGKKSSDSKQLPITNEIPQVKIVDKELLVTLGQWLGILPALKTQGIPGLYVSYHTTAKELMNSTKISQEDLNLVPIKFGEILSFLGIDSSQTCILSGFNSVDYSFKCKISSGEEKEMELRWGDLFETSPQLVVKYDNTEEEYYYLPAYKENRAKLVLSQLTKKSLDNGNEFARYTSPIIAIFTVKNNNTVLTINIKRLDEVTDYNEMYQLPNESKLQDFLLSITFPIKIGDLYRKLEEIAINDEANYKGISVEVKKDNEITDLIHIFEGKVTRIKMTRDGKSITLIGEDAWEYKSPKLSVGNEDGTISMSVTLSTEGNDIAEFKAKDQLDIASGEVESVRRLTRDIFKKNN